MIVSETIKNHVLKEYSRENSVLKQDPNTKKRAHVPASSEHSTKRNY